MYNVKEVNRLLDKKAKIENKIKLPVVLIGLDNMGRENKIYRYISFKKLREIVKIFSCLKDKGMRDNKGKFFSFVQGEMFSISDNQLEELTLLYNQKAKEVGEIIDKLNEFDEVYFDEIEC